MNKLIVLFYTFIAPFAHLACRLRRCDRISFLSRQGSESLDFDLLEAQLHQLEPKTQVKRACKQVKGVLALGVLTLRQLWLIATSKAVVVDGYVPALSLLEGKDTPPSVQIWHAVGAIKKFGYQSLDTEAGHTTQVALSMKMHRNYTKIVSAGPGCIPAYAEAFGYRGEASRVFEPLGIPRMDYLFDANPDCQRKRNTAAALEQNPWLAQANTVRILYAPTLRNGAGYENWLATYVEALAQALNTSTAASAKPAPEPASEPAPEPAPAAAPAPAPAPAFQLLVSGHPLDCKTQGLSQETLNAIKFVPGFKTIDLFDLVDYVITDYSAIALEAGLAGKPVLFYVPDYRHYCTSPGLNIDPIKQFGAISSTEASAVINAIVHPDQQVTKAHAAYAAFIEAYFQGVGYGCTERVARLIVDLAKPRG